MTYSFFTQSWWARVVIPCLLVLLPFALPAFAAPLDVSDFLTVVSILFAIFVGFFIAAATTNYFSLQAATAEEESGLITVFNFATLVQPSCRKRLADAIDRYMIAAISVPIIQSVRHTEQAFLAIVDILDDLEPSGDEKRRVAALTYLHEVKAGIFLTRQKIAFSAPPVVGKIHWVIIIGLGVTLAALLLLISEASVFSEFLAGILIAALYFVLIVLYETDGNRLLEEQLGCEDAQSVFEAIGKPRYYPSWAVALGIVSSSPGTYRTDAEIR